MPLKEGENGRGAGAVRRKCGEFKNWITLGTEDHLERQLQH